MGENFSMGWGVRVGEGVDRRQSSGSNLSKTSLACLPLTHLLCGQFLTVHGLVLVCAPGVVIPVVGNVKGSKFFLIYFLL